MFVKAISARCRSHQACEHPTSVTFNKCSVFFALILVIMWTVSISTTLCLEYLSISNKMIGRLKFSPRALHSFSLCRTSLSRTFPYIEQIVQPPKPFSLSISNIYIFEFHFRIPKLIRI